MSKRSEVTPSPSYTNGTTEVPAIYVETSRNLMGILLGLTLTFEYLGGPRSQPSPSSTDGTNEETTEVPAIHVQTSRNF